MSTDAFSRSNVPRAARTWPLIVALACLLPTLSGARPPPKVPGGNPPVIEPGDGRGRAATASPGAHLDMAPAAPEAFYRPSHSPGNGQSVSDFGAVGNGVADDTDAINAALNAGRLDDDGNMNQPSPDDYNGRTRFVYLPPGTYRVSNRLRWVGCCLTMRGAGPGRTVIKLVDDAPGYGDRNAPRAVVETQSGNESFRQYVMDMTVDTGRGNPGAIGVNYVSSNMGALRNVRIRSGDGRGYAGVGMDRAWTGPALVKDVAIDGFDYGVTIGPGEYGPVFEGVTISNHRLAGIRSTFGAPSIRHLVASGQGPGFLGTGAPNFVALDDSVMIHRGQHARRADPAISSVGDLFVRDLLTVGYGNAVTVRGSSRAGTRVDEFASNVFTPTGAGQARGLDLPVKETPQVRGGAPAQWFRFPDGADYGNLRRLQQYVDQMAASGQDTLYFPFDQYFSYNEVAVDVPAGINRIIGYSSTINSDSAGTNGGGLRLVVDAASPVPLVIEQFGYGVKIDHRGPRSVAIKHGSYRYIDGGGTGDVFFEDVGGPPLTVTTPKNIWARQLNIESIGSRRTKFDNRAARAWILGFKTEGAGGIFKVSGNARTELLGGFMLPNLAEPEIPAFECDASAGDARMSLSYRYEAYDAGGVNRKHTIQFRDRRNGAVHDLRTDADVPRRIGLFRCG